jgi:aminopeptidase-like protein
VVTPIGSDMYSWLSDLFPFNRSLTGKGVEETLMYLQGIFPNLVIHRVATGTDAYDWKIPYEWNVATAYIENSSGIRFASYQENNLHLVGYSIPVNKLLTKEELLPHLHYLDKQPNAIPYITSYYEKNWGFCLTYDEFLQLGEGPFRVVIDSELKVGHMSYGEIFIPGTTQKEILLSTYICHPSMASNELSGPVVATALACWVQENKLKHSVRILFLPETIGSIYYISRHLKDLQRNLRAGWVLTCLGDNQALSFLPSKAGNLYVDSVSRRVLSRREENFREFDWVERGSDERQYCSPGIDLPVASVMRSKYGEYPEYHTSLDNLEFVSAEGLQTSFEIYQQLIIATEQSKFPKIRVLGEPQLSRRGLYPATSDLGTFARVVDRLSVISFMDGTLDTEQIASLCKMPVDVAEGILNELDTANLIDWV